MVNFARSVPANLNAVGRPRDLHTQPRPGDGVVVDDGVRVGQGADVAIGADAAARIAADIITGDGDIRIAVDYDAEGLCAIHVHVLDGVVGDVADDVAPQHSRRTASRGGGTVGAIHHQPGDADRHLSRSGDLAAVLRAAKGDDDRLPPLGTFGEFERFGREGSLNDRRPAADERQVFVDDHLFHVSSRRHVNGTAGDAIHSVLHGGKGIIAKGGGGAGAIRVNAGQGAVPVVIHPYLIRFAFQIQRDGAAVFQLDGQVVYVAGEVAGPGVARRQHDVLDGLAGVINGGCVAGGRPI